MAGSGALAICLAGCGRSSQEKQLSDQARKIVDRRKVDVEQRPTSPKSGTGRSNSRSGQQRP
jgi:hypothetical protein